ENQGAAAHPLRGDRRAHQRRLARVRGGAQGEQEEVRGVLLPRHATRLQQRHDPALRRRGGEAGLEADGRLLQEGTSRLAGASSLPRRGPPDSIRQRMLTTANSCAERTWCLPGAPRSRAVAALLIAF